MCILEYAKETDMKNIDKCNLFSLACGRPEMNWLSSSERVVSSETLFVCFGKKNYSGILKCDVLGVK